MAADSVPSDRDEPSGPRYTTLGINLAGRWCLIVGGGRIGSRKAATLAAGGAEVIVVAPAISEACRNWSPPGACGGSRPSTMRPCWRAPRWSWRPRPTKR